MTKNMTKKQTILTESPVHYPVAFLDYMYVITIYSTCAFFCSVLIDGYIIPIFNLQISIKRYSIVLAVQILLQLAVQGFIAIFLYALLQKINSPFDGLYGYRSDTPLGLTVRSPAIISVILFYLSTSLHDKLMILFNRFSGRPQTQGLPNSKPTNTTPTNKDNKESDAKTPLHTATNK
jgi:hypothetical protein